MYKQKNHIELALLSRGTSIYFINIETHLYDSSFQVELQDIVYQIQFALSIIHTCYYVTIFPPQTC
jgi:hypothetical protein